MALPRDRCRLRSRATSARATRTTRSSPTRGSCRRGNWAACVRSRGSIRVLRFVHPAARCSSPKVGCPRAAGVRCSACSRGGRRRHGGRSAIKPGAGLRPSLPVENPAGIAGVEPIRDDAVAARVGRCPRRGDPGHRRRRRSGSAAPRGVERQQFKWFAFAAGAPARVVARARADGRRLPDQLAAMLRSASRSPASPSPSGVAILRYRLYEIDRVISQDARLRRAHRDPRRRVRRARARGPGRVLVLRGRLEPRDRRARRSSSPRSSCRCARACSGSSTAASTAAATTPSARSRRSARGCASRSTSTRSAPTSRASYARRCSRRTCRSGCAATRMSRASRSSWPAPSRRRCAWSGSRRSRWRWSSRPPTWHSRQRLDRDRDLPHVLVGVVGALVASRLPRTRSAGSSSASSSRSALSGAADGYAELSVDHGARAAGSCRGRPGTRTSVVRRLLRDAPLRLLLFPNGRLLTRRWRIVLWAGTVGLLRRARVAVLLRPGTLERLPAVRRTRPAIDSPVCRVLFAPRLRAASALALIGAVVSRRRCASGVPRGIERQQLKVLVAAGAVVATATFVISGLHRASWTDADLGIAITLLGVLAIPVGVGVAMLRYRLYDDRPRDLADARLRRADGDPRRGVRRARARRAGGVLVVRGRLEPRDRRCRRSSSRRCSCRCARACSGSSTGASTGAATTRSARSRRSARGCARRSSWRRSTAELRGVVDETMQPAHVVALAPARRARMSRRTRAGRRVDAARDQLRLVGSRERA